MAYCTNCGSELEKNVNFCTECGTAVNGQPQSSTQQKSTRPSASEGELLMTLKPVFVSKLAYLRSIPVVIFLGLFLSFFLFPLVTGILGFILSLFIGDLGYLAATFIYILSWIIGVPVLFRWLTKRNYEETEYNIYDDKVEYSEGYLNVSKNIARLNRIVDVHFKKGILQKRYGLGTITMDMAGGGKRNAIRLLDLENPEEIYEELQDLIAENESV